MVVSARRSPRFLRWIQLLGAVLVTLVLSLLLAPRASAHAYLASSDPADGAVLAGAPSQLQLHFSESVVLGATSLELVDSAGTRYRPTGLRIAGQDEGQGGDTEAPVTLVAALPALPHSAYRLSWATLSRDDLHRTSGVIVFGIGEQVAPAGNREPLPPATEVGLRWLLFTGFALAAGGLLGARLIRRTSADPGGQRRCYRMTAIAAALSGSAAAILLIRQSGGGVGDALSGRYGLGWLTREAGLLLLAVLGWLRWRRPGLRLGPLAPLGIAACCLGSALVGHGSAAGLSYLTADAAHLAAAGLWIGGLLALLVGCRSRAALTAALLAFGRPAGLALATVVGTGVYLASGVVASVDAALATGYGRTLLVKLALFGAVALLGLFHHRRLRSHCRVGRTLGLEAVLGLAVLAAAAVLTSSQPAREPAFVRAGPAPASSLNGQAQDLQQTLAMSPNRPGQNVLLVHIYDTRRPAPAPIQAVRLRITDAAGVTSSPLTAQELPDRTWSVPVRIGSGGPATVEVTVERPGLAPVTSGYRWRVGAAPIARHRVLVSNAPIRRPLRWIGLLAMLVVALGAALAGARRRVRPAGRPPRAGLPGQWPDQPSPDPELAGTRAG